MPNLPIDRDSPEAALRRAMQEDPWVMYLVVKYDEACAPNALLVAGAQATVRCADTYATTAAWSGAFAAWGERSFRKVCLRAKGSAWEKLAGYEAGEGGIAGRCVVRALPPRVRSERDALLKGLQVYNPDHATLVAEAADDEPGEPAMRFVINPAAAMTLGKQVAQVAHAVLMCAWAPRASDAGHREAFAAWRAAGYPGRVMPPGEWARARAAAGAIVVRDGGLTEVEPGTETVVALGPGLSRIRAPFGIARGSR